MNAYEYFKAIAESNVDIGHVDETNVRFVRGRVGEMIGNTILKLDGFCLIYYNLEGDTHGKNVDQMYENSLVNFAIVKAVPKGDYDAKEDAENEAMNIGNEIKAKIYKDYEDGILSLQDLKISHRKYKPGIDGEAGYLFEVDINFPKEIIYNEEKWA